MQRKYNWHNFQSDGIPNKSITLIRANNNYSRDQSSFVKNQLFKKPAWRRSCKKSRDRLSTYRVGRVGRENCQIYEDGRRR